MWHIEKLELRPGTLDFTSSGQGWRKVTQLFADGIQLINAIELVDWGADDTQFLICEACGMEGCKRGDWVRIRRTDSLVFILPSFDYIWAERADDKTEYSPPRYLKTHGVGYFDRSNYEDLRSKHDQFPSFTTLQPLNMREATLAFHLTAPVEVLGPAPEVRVRHELIVGVSEGSAADRVKQLEEVIRRQYQDEARANLRPLLESEVPLSIYLDASEFIDWKALVFAGNSHQLVVDSRFVIVLEHSI
ncbi:MAG TPA: hypothetical protein VHH35_02735 [Pyrinomonadaceae bacterium]|nr:hypothetical protein [Pyrinomonadaceae bacterium]